MLIHNLRKYHLLSRLLIFLLGNFCVWCAGSSRIVLDSLKTFLNGRSFMSRREKHCVWLYYRCFQFHSYVITLIGTGVVAITIDAMFNAPMSILVSAVLSILLEYFTTQIAKLVHIFYLPVNVHNERKVIGILFMIGLVSSFLLIVLIYFFAWALTKNQ